MAQVDGNEFGDELAFIHCTGFPKWTEGLQCQ